MVDRKGRDNYAETARHFLAGVLTVDEYENRADSVVLDTEDDGVFSIYWTVWGLYCDFRTERMREEWALTPEVRQDMARCLLFLYSDCEYPWPLQSPNYVGCFLNILSLGLWSRRNEARRQERLRQIGEPEHWPFLNRAEYEAALLTPKFFTPRP